jgi:hypothetical protein
MSTEVVVHDQTGVALFRQSTDAAGMCKAIVLQTAKNIQGRKFVPVEGWQAIAIAHGCVASAGDVERTETGFRAIGWIKRADNGQLISTAEGFVGDDEPMWAKRAEYAKRAMAQTRAISRACRSAFAHVVVMMNAGLSTTPAEEMTFDQEGTDNGNAGVGGADSPPPPAHADASGPAMSPSQERLIRAKLKSAAKTELDFASKYPAWSLTPKEGKVLVPKAEVNNVLAWIEGSAA